MLTAMRMSLRQIGRAPNVVKLLFVQQLLEGFTPIMALYAIMFSRSGHLDLQQIGLLFSIWALAYVAAELPTGVLADVWSRRNVIIAGGIVRAAGFIIWIHWPVFAGYAAGFALWGVMIACSSGSVAAYLDSELRDCDAGKSFSKYFGWIMAANSFGLLAAYGMAAVLTLRHVDALIMASILSSVLYSAVLAFAPERPDTRQVNYFTTLRAGVVQVLQSKRLRYVSAVMCSVYLIIGVLEELLPRVYAGFGLGDTWVSLLGGAALVISALLLVRLESVVQFSLTWQVTVMIAGLVLLMIGLVWGVAAASVLVLLFNLVFHLFRPVFMHHVQQTAHGRERATINSIPSLVAGLLSAVAYALIGGIAQITSQNFSIGLYAGLWFIVLTMLAYAGRKYKISHRPAIEPEALQTPHTVS